jgi:hypothetical protein
VHFAGIHTEREAVQDRYVGNSRVEIFYFKHIGPDT